MLLSVLLMCDCREDGGKRGGGEEGWSKDVGYQQSQDRLDGRLAVSVFIAAVLELFGFGCVWR